MNPHELKSTDARANPSENFSVNSNLGLRGCELSRFVNETPLPGNLFPSFGPESCFDCC